MIDLQETLRLHGLWLSGRAGGSRADLTGADLTRADLTRADLTRADLTRADLTGADLTDAVLTDAVLRDAVLTDADLTGADLRGADLRGADLTDAVLTDADLRGADLRGADLTDAVLTDAVLTDADLTGADLRGADLRELTVPRLHSKILAHLEDGAALEMSDWHLNDASCGTQHCHAGWAIHEAGEAGATLEKAVGPAAAGAIIISLSCPYLERVPNFYASNKEAMAEIRRCAAIEAALPTEEG